MNAAALNSPAHGAGAAGLFAISFHESVLPWSVAAADERRFRRIARRVLAVVLLLGFVLPFVPPHKPERQRAEALPPPLARLLLERAAAPAPPAPVAQAEAPKPAADAPSPTRPEARADERAPVPEARRPQPNKPPGEAIAEARRRASGVGLLAASHEIAAIAAAPAAVQLRQDIAPGSGVGTGTGPGVGAGADAGVPVRAMITAAAGRGSGGLNNAAFSRDAGGGGLAGRATTVVEGQAGGGGGGGPGGGGTGGRGMSGAGGGGGGALTRGGGGAGKASRSIEEIRLVFERNKGAIYALYSRALRDDPSLQGKVVIELKIAPSGAVTDCRIVSSELKADDLERKLAARVRQFDFGTKDVQPMVVNWPVDFLPS